MFVKDSAGVKETVNSFITPKGNKRVLEVEISENYVDIDFTLENSAKDSVFKSICLNKREALALLFYLIRILLPNKFLANKIKKETKTN